MSTDFQGCHPDDPEPVGYVAESLAAVVGRGQENLGAGVCCADHLLLYSDTPRLLEGAERSNELLKAIQAQHIATTQTALVAAEDGFAGYPSANILRQLVFEPGELADELNLCGFLQESRTDLIGREASELAVEEP